MNYRSHTCGALRAEHAGTIVTLSGWVDSRRDHGGVIFIDLRDRAGITQIVFRPDEFPAVADLSHGLRSEDVIRVVGAVSPRLEGTENARLATGAIEVVASELDVLNKSDVLPFPLDA
ncbi:MAG: OB-fold nucleic acid binding domain-containing protein, partial [Chthoniobacterales bacterium]